MFAHGLSIALLFAHRRRNPRAHRHARVRRSRRSRQSDAVRRARFRLRRLRRDRSARLREFCRRNHDFLRRVSGTAGKWNGFHIFQIATVLALWGVVISTVYMLRAYRATFMGTMRERWQQLPILTSIACAVTLLVAHFFASDSFRNRSCEWCADSDFFPQTQVQCNHALSCRAATYSNDYSSAAKLNDRQ